MTRHKLIHIGIILILVLILANIMYINYVLFISSRSAADNSAGNLADIKPASGPKNADDKGTTKEITQADYSLILEQIKAATDSVTRAVASIAAQNSQPEAKLPVAASSLPKSVREYYISLGSSSTTASQWTDLGGIEAIVVPANIGRIREMYFEAGLKIPSSNGQVSARLINVTDNNPLIESEVQSEGSEGKLVSSGKIPVPTTPKLYRVQMKSSLGVEADLENARLKLFIEV